MGDACSRRRLHPVLVSGGGRSGTTLLMLLLGTSPRIVFDRVHPYEHRYLTFLLRWAQLLHPGRAPKSWNQVAMVSRADGMMGPLPWAEAGLVEGEVEFWQQCFLLAWEELSARAARAVEVSCPGVIPTHYAEKAPPWLAGELAGLLSPTVLLPVRDPRDVFLSVVSFVDKRGAPGFGMRPSESPEEFAPRFVQLQKRRLREAGRALETGSATVVRYEDLVHDLPGQAGRLGDLLGVPLDPTGVNVGQTHYQQHSTTGSPAESVGRWRREMDAEIKALFSRELAGELGPLGYDP